jgi:hypothetical protein
MEWWDSNNGDINIPQLTLSYWGYLHTNGIIQVKRYFGYQDILNAKESSFCGKIVGPIQALNREDAYTIIKQLIYDS